MPGITGQMYRQFALVIASTALISAINALTLKPTQCALFLRPTCPAQRKNIVFRGFDRALLPAGASPMSLIARMVTHSGMMAVHRACADGGCRFRLSGSRPASSRWRIRAI